MNGHCPHLLAATYPYVHVPPPPPPPITRRLYRVFITDSSPVFESRHLIYSSVSQVLESFSTVLLFV